MTEMKDDARILAALEADTTSPSIDEWRKDVDELFATPVRILYACFVRDKFRVDSPDGLSHLRTLLHMLPDTTFVENLHQHCRDLARNGRRVVITRQARARACIDSGVIEQRLGPQSTLKVEKDEFVSGFSKRAPSLASKFNPKRHKMHKRFM